LKEKTIKNQEQDTKKEIISTFAEIINDSNKEALKYVKNWKAPGGGE